MTDVRLQTVPYIIVAVREALFQQRETGRRSTDAPCGKGRKVDALLHGLDELPPVDESDPHVLLVLDDLHRAQSPAVHSLLAAMLDFGPATLHLMLLTRRAGELPLARLYAREQLVALTSDDLRFNGEEIAAYLTAKSIQELTAGHLSQIADRSEGWIAALQLAVLSLKKPGNAEELAAMLQGDRGWLAEFLSSEVLNRQPPELRRFLLQTSILDEFNASLATAVTGDAASQTRIAALKRGDIFLIRLDSRDEWFRYHHLFQDLLQRRLIEQTDPTALARLHQRAAAWWVAAEQVARAVHHLLGAALKIKPRIRWRRSSHERQPDHADCPENNCKDRTPPLYAF